jgi:hypothetical protein
MPSAVRPDPSILGVVGAWEAHAASAARTSSQATRPVSSAAAPWGGRVGRVRVLLGLGADVGDQLGSQVVLGELVAEPGDGKADHVAGRQGSSSRRAWAASRLSQRHCSSVT